MEGTVRGAWKPCCVDQHLPAKCPYSSKCELAKRHTNIEEANKINTLFSIHRTGFPKMLLDSLSKQHRPMGACVVSSKCIPKGCLHSKFFFKNFLGAFLISLADLGKLEALGSKLGANKTARPMTGTAKILLCQLPPATSSQP